MTDVKSEQGGGGNTEGPFDSSRQTDGSAGGNGAPRLEAFSTELDRLFDVFVHSVYAERDVFLRELIANAADAMEKRRFLAVSDSRVDADAKMAIEIEADPRAGTLSIRDTGLGMSASDMRDNLGTIASSSTKRFLEEVNGDADAAHPGERNSNAASKGEEGQNLNLIGQFGIGFYSAFMVADAVEVTSRKVGEPHVVRWHSRGSGGYTLQEFDKTEIPDQGVGTCVKLTLKADARAYLESAKIEQIVTQHASHVPFPICWRERDTTRRLTSGAAPWSRPASAVSAKEYASLYQEIAASGDEPLATMHIRVEGLTSFAAIAYVPGTRQADIFDNDRRAHMRLYVRRVYITDQSQLLPGYLRFLRGVVDAEDLPLNVSREMLQKTPDLARVRRILCSRILREFKTLAENEPARWLKIWSRFGDVFKEGLYEDPANRDKLLPLCRFSTLLRPEESEPVGLEDYVKTMVEGQEHIYTLIGEAKASLRLSPVLEAFRACGVDVLLLSDPIDAFWTQQVSRFGEHDLRAADASDADLSRFTRLTAPPGERISGGESQPEDAGVERAMGVLLARAKQTLASVVGEVRKTDRLTHSPACIVRAEGAPDPVLMRYLSRQDRDGAASLGEKPVFELNPKHSIIRRMAARATSPEQSAVIDDGIWLLFEQARLVDGQPPSDLERHSAALHRMLAARLLETANETLHSTSDASATAADPSANAP